ncbi:MAG: putative sensor protein [Frankiales bacterium]|nr:putative sensor protein [Frankiales bacterium]
MATGVPQRLDLSAEPSSVGEARRFVRGVLGDWGLDDAVEVVALLVSELATNAVLHARTAYAVIISADDDDICVEVLDRSEVPPRQRQNSPSAATGRGVGLVDQLSRSWGSRPADHGFAKSVWFTVPREVGQAGGDV